MTVCCQGVGDIFGQVNEHRTWAAFGGNEIGLGHHAGDIGGVTRNIAMFNNGKRDAHNIHFLERVCAHQICRHLARDKDNRDRVQIGIGDGGDEVCCAGARGGEGRPRFTCRAGIANRGHTAALLMTAQYMTQLGHGRQHIIDGHNGPARIAKDCVHTLRGNRFKQELRA